MIQLLTPDQFDSIFSIMEKSFPKDEYRTYEGQKALFEEPAYRIYGQVDEKSGKLNGFLSAWEFEPVVFFEHFAISRAEKWRNRRSHAPGDRRFTEKTGVSGG